MLDPESLVGGDALAQFALILAVPVRAHRNREFRLRPVAAQAFEDRRGLFGRQLAAVPVVSSERCAYAASERFQSFTGPNQLRNLP